MSFKSHFHSRYLIESPEVVANIYDRDNYDFDFFLGDERGALIVPNDIGFTSHAMILRYLVRNGFLNNDYELVSMDKFPYKVIGKPVIVDMNYSGIILPKQSDVKKTYISFWTKAAFESMADFLLDYTENEYEGAIDFEVTNGFDSKSKIISND